MKYKLIGNNDTNNIIEQVLLNRGIVNPIEYLSLNDSCINDYNNLTIIDIGDRSLQNVKSAVLSSIHLLSTIKKIFLN